MYSDDTNTSTFGERFRKLRRSLHLTQAEAAERLGVSRVSDVTKALVAGR